MRTWKGSLKPWPKRRLNPIEPGYARKLLRDLAGWAQTIGFAPARDFAAVELLFGNVRAETCDTAFQFGREGKPLYIADLSEAPGGSGASRSERLEHLQG